VGAYYGGFYAPSDATGDIHKFTRGLAAACARRGAQFVYDADVQQVSASDAGVRMNGVYCVESPDRPAPTNQRSTASGRMVAKGRIVESRSTMKQPIKPWRDRAPKADPSCPCCWICGGIGGNGFTMALRLAGYRMAPGEIGYAHNDCMRKAQIQAIQHQRRIDER
jgi:hypothetical protein